MPYLSNNRVAWRIPPGLAVYYEQSYYVPLKGWKVVDSSSVIGWKLGKFGELRRSRLRTSKGQQKLRKVERGDKDGTNATKDPNP